MFTATPYKNVVSYVWNDKISTALPDGVAIYGNACGKRIFGAVVIVPYPTDG